MGTYVHFDPEGFIVEANRLRQASLAAELEKAGEDERLRQLILQQDRLFAPKVTVISAMLSMRNSGVEDAIILAAMAEFGASIATMAAKTSPSGVIPALHSIMKMMGHSTGLHLFAPQDEATSVEIQRETGGRA